MWLGPKRKSEALICGAVPVRKCKVLGIWFSAIEDCTAENVGSVVSKIEKKLDQWRQRDLTLKGKITVGKTLALSQLIYVMSVEQIPKKYLELIQSHLMKFLWRGRPPKVSKKTLCQDIKASGLSCPDVTLMYRANRAAWMARMDRARHTNLGKVF